MNYEALKAEVIGDPLARGYAGMTDKEVSDRVYVVDRTRNRQSMSASEVFNALDMSEFNPLPDASKAKVWDVLGIGDLNPFGNEASQMAAVFGAGSNSIANLKALRVDEVSRAVELGLGRVGPGVVAEVRK